jgi:hypothetical protein
MDVGAAVRDGVTFFTHKATEGTKTQHIHYGDALSRARAAGMPFMGAYLVVRTPGNNGHGSIQAQVNYFLAYLNAQTPWWRTLSEFFIQVDTEHWGYDDVAPQYGVLACDLLRGQAGKLVVHYVPRWAYGDTVGGDHPLWASSYGSNPAVHYRQAYPGDGSSRWAPYSGRDPTILQYGSKLTVGSQPSCDGNAFRGSVDQFRALVLGGKMTTLDDSVVGADGIRRGYARIIADLEDELILGSDFGRPNGAVNRLKRVETKIDALQSPVAPTQEQVNAAILSAMLDSRVLKGIGDAIASHLHVT